MADDDHGHEAIYDASALAWDRDRKTAFPERFLLDRLLGAVPEGGSVLDLGCGAGRPVAAYLVDQGLMVLGVDFSAKMLRLARENVPRAEWLRADMRKLELGRKFDAIIAWDSLFHLTKDEQRALFPRLCRQLAPQGWLLFTCGPKDSEVWGRVAGGPVYHASLSPDDYRDCLSQEGADVVDFVAEDPLVWGRTWCLAQKRGSKN